MTRFLNHALVIASLSLGIFAAAPAQAASVTQVSRSTWGATGVPSYVNMYIYVPDQLAAKPPILVAHHSCGTPVSGYVNSIQKIRVGADRTGFILILPEATGRNCWDVGTMQSLTHDGGGDTQAIAQMVKYALMQYDGDPERVYAMGGSSGAMMTQALLAVYPDIFKAGSARAGVPAGCWAAGFDQGQQWSNSCAGGNTTKTAEQWGEQARGMFPGYTGPRRRIQIFHGTADTTINYKNFAEAIKQWTNVLGLDATPTATDTKMTSVSTYDRQFWKNECGFTVFETWSGRNGTHSMAYEEDDILAFFGLDQAGGTDPETACPPGGGTGGAGGMGGAAGSAGAPVGGTGAGNGGVGPVAGSPGIGGSAGSLSGGGGGGPAAGSGGAGGSGGTALGGSGPGVGGMSPAGAPSVAGTTGMAGRSGAPGAAGNATGGKAGSSNTGTEDDSGNDASGEGCSIVVGKRDAKPAYAAFVALGLAALALRRRRSARASH